MGGGRSGMFNSAWCPEYEGVNFVPRYFLMTSRGRTCLVYHVDEGLGVVFMETTDRLDSILA